MNNQFKINALEKVRQTLEGRLADEYKTPYDPVTEYDPLKWVESIEKITDAIFTCDRLINTHRYVKEREDNVS